MDNWTFKNKDAYTTKVGCILRDRFGVKAEGFMIGGMNPTPWFNDLVIQGWAIISDETDLNGWSPLPFTGPDGNICVCLLDGVSQLGQRNQMGYSGDWIVRYDLDDIRIFRAKAFNYEFTIVKPEQ